MYIVTISIFLFAFHGFSTDISEQAKIAFKAEQYLEAKELYLKALRSVEDPIEKQKLWTNLAIVEGKFKEPNRDDQIAFALKALEFGTNEKASFQLRKARNKLKCIDILCF